MKTLIAGNWKMNGSTERARDLAANIAKGLAAREELLEKCELLVCPPYPYLPPVRETLKNAQVNLGGQDCAVNENGAYTGDVSAEMLADVGCGYVILGHSERREYHGETSELVAQKAARAHSAGLKTIICVGEKESERDGGYETDVVGVQLDRSVPETATAQNTVIAYEPVWAIGTGRTAQPGDVRSMHSFIRKNLENKLEDSADFLILYGGSVKPGNAKELFAIENVNGGLIGGASLKAEDFLAIAAAA